MFDINNIVRENIKQLKPYSSARDEFSGAASVYLDANENSLGSPLHKNYHRYPDPLQWKLKEEIAKIKGVPALNTFLGNGSDECIDLLYRAFCNPGKDNVVICPPTYGMYEVSAHINDIEVREAVLDKEFQLQPGILGARIDEFTKIIFICSPNNPTGNIIYHDDIENLLSSFEGLVVIDEAYVNFSRYPSFLPRLSEFPNLLVLQTFSKAWGLAGLRLGMLFGSLEIVTLLNKIKPPYNINQATQEMALEALTHIDMVNDRVRQLVAEREALRINLEGLPFVQAVYPSEANFLLVKMNDARSVYQSLVAKGIIVRDRSRVLLCEDCLRITVGTSEEDEKLLTALREITNNL